MKNMKIAIALAFLALPMFAQQNTLVATTLASAVTANSRTVVVASATGISAGNVTTGTVGSQLYVVDVGQVFGETMDVLAISGTTVTVARTTGQTVAHASGAMVLVGPPNQFYKYNPTGSCVTAQTYVTPWVNTLTGQQWLCSSQTLTWVPGWGNTAATPQLITATATASVAGATAITSPLVEISGTEAITSFTMGVGWNGYGFCVLPTAAFTTVAGNNIAEASTADANQTLCFTWNARAAAFAASY